jgi:hypothetical protein
MTGRHGSMNRPATSAKTRALLDLQRAEHNVATQRGVQAYITNLEGELTKALRSLETTLDISD